MLAAMSPSPAAFEPAPERAGRGRDDACPGAMRLHAADDGALARVRVPGGLLAGDQTRALADAAAELGDGALEATSRGNLQLRGLAPDAGAELAARLRAVGLLPSDSHDRVRNLVASPLAGLRAAAAPATGTPTSDAPTTGAGEPADPRRTSPDLRPWVRALDALLCASPTAGALSGRFLFALDDGWGDVAALDADVTLIARVAVPSTPTDTTPAPVEPAAARPALLRLGRAHWCAEVADGPRAALAVAEEFARLAAAGVWRIREADPDGTVLAERLGLVPRPLPAWSEPSERPPAVGPCAGGLAVGLRFGRGSADQWRALAALGDELRVTPWRSVVVPGAGAERLPELAALGLRTVPGTPWERATACTGSPG
ncbi:precorrin-3B synthase [Kitasatospora nipponensis]|uniref:Precorrin-3B synthase n=1 Tax=Kitasatospora nipponensis TaxID=258049 RepID=A0ABN1W8C1_9ACTN